MKRVFLVDVLHCPCGGERRILAAITEAPVIRAILRALDLPDEPPVRGWARAPPDGPGAVIDGHTEIRLVLE